MLQMRNSRFAKMLPELLASGVAIQEEGVALTFVKENGETKVEIGVAGGKFAGVAIARHSPPSLLPMVESGAIPEAGTGKLTRTPKSGQVLVKIDGVVANIVSGVPAAGEVAIAGDAYTFHTDNAGQVAEFQYMYVPSVIEARTILGDMPYGGQPADAIGSVSVVKQGEVATSFFDASADWSTALYAKVGAGGVFQPASAAQGIAGVTVKNSPSAANPFLVLALNLG